MQWKSYIIYKGIHFIYFCPCKFSGGYNNVTNVTNVIDEYDEYSDDEVTIHGYLDDDVGYGGCYGGGTSSSDGMGSKLTNAIIDNIFPTAKTSVIGKDVGEFELLTSSSV